MDPYQILGIPSTATDAEIKNAYRQRAKEFHPDRNKSAQAGDRLVEINAAYEILTDPARRALYDSGYRDAEVAYEEDPREIRRREYLRRRRAQEQREAEEQTARRDGLYILMRILMLLAFAFAMALITDPFLPLTAHDEMPVDRRPASGTTYPPAPFVVYFSTENHTVVVPEMVYDRYWSAASHAPAKVFTTPLFDVPREMQVVFADGSWSVNVDSPHPGDSILPWLLLATSGFVIARKRYSGMGVLAGITAIVLVNIIVGAMR